VPCGECTSNAAGLSFPAMPVSAGKTAKVLCSDSACADGRGRRACTKTAAGGRRCNSASKCVSSSAHRIALEHTGEARRKRACVRFQVACTPEFPPNITRREPHADAECAARACGAEPCTSVGTLHSDVSAAHGAAHSLTRIQYNRLQINRGGSAAQRCAAPAYASRGSTGPRAIPAARRSCHRNGVQRGPRARCTRRKSRNVCN
jgi:hypothetical protein